ncbi:MAG: DNA repair photolyase [Chlamydiales bacterium]|jgi:DNA repair photolyase
MPRRVSNPPNPWASTHVEWLEEAPAVEVEVFEERAGSILQGNDSPDVPFRYSVNPYRGCQHACAYCYARPGHQYLGFGAGTDFDSKIVVKLNAAELLTTVFRRRSWERWPVSFSGVTDAYQPLEASYGLTRACLEVCARFHNPVAIITKSALVRRDAELLAEIQKRAGAEVYLSIPFAEDGMGRSIEPLAAAPSMRFETLRVLSDAGVSTGVALAPIIPGLNDSDIPEILRRAHEAGARRAFMILLRLPAEVEGVFRERLESAYPMRVERVWNAMRDMRGGHLKDARFGHRMTGSGPRWETLRQLFDIHCRRLGFDLRERESEAPLGRKSMQQGLLFDAE